jgi:hypothetical protein
MKALKFSASAAKFLVLKPLGTMFPSLFSKGRWLQCKLKQIRNLFNGAESIANS